MNQNNLLEKYKKQIEEISSKELNSDQKNLAIQILEKFEPSKLEYIFQFISQRIKTGFRFDAAPESNSDLVAILQKNENLSFVLDKSQSEENTLIIGENYDALKNLLVLERERERERERESRAGYDVIYIDPPYNTQASFNEGNQIANDKENILPSKFIYRDKYSRNGWLNLLNERLNLAKKLLKEDGLIFVSIDDNQHAYLKVLMDEIFGEENFVTNIVWVKKNSPGGNTSFDYKITQNTEYILTYAKNLNKCKFNYQKHDEKTLKKLGYTLEDKYFEQRGYYKLIDLHHTSSTGAFKYIKSLDYPIIAPDGTSFTLYLNKNSPESACYTWGKETFVEGEKHGFIEIVKNSRGDWVAKRKQYQNVKFNPKTKKIEQIQAGLPFKNIISDFYSLNGGLELKEIFNSKNIFDFPKPVELISHLINIHPNKNARVLDFFAGSGTTGHAVWNLNRQDGGERTFTLVTNNQNNIATDVTYERLFRVSNGKGTKNEEFNWSKNNKPYLENLKVFDISYYNTQIFDSESGLNDLVNLFLKLFKDFDIKVSLNHINTKNTRYVELLNHLLALKPQEKDV
ncbi:site-specific DNA-methyltransferase [Mesomycoplasma ovipneumoniae]|uniref:site-specific DNA-methyltransferase n=1 Tax=Mesomycoplasma ovipneumoniae TaxID=29562 RepID=UPI0028B23C84|nr:DNA methyltransferase [Mesomycoplasma ovipneumoniae]WNM15912.1 DNA methyltransferase [Mesomycoplasma ovipneumoniae]